MVIIMINHYTRTYPQQFKFEANVGCRGGGGGGGVGVVPWFIYREWVLVGQYVIPLVSAEIVCHSSPYIILYKSPTRVSRNICGEGTYCVLFSTNSH